MKLKLLIGAAAGTFALTGAANAAVLFTSTFENVTGGPANSGDYTTVQMADDWYAGTNGTVSGAASNGIELQNHAAGDPAADGGNVFVELDTTANSSMYHTISNAGNYTFSFEYSPRPNNPATSNGISVYLDGVLLNPPGNVTGAGGSSTAWSYQQGSFTANAGSTLAFVATGTSDSLGGYVDNISVDSVSAAPEPGIWALMLGGVAALGLMLRAGRRRAVGIFA